MPRTVQDIMNRELLAIRPDLPVNDARALLRSFRIGAAPVLDDDRRAVGVVSLRDLLDAGGTAQERMSRPALCVSISAPIEAAARQLARGDVHHLVVVDGTGAAVGMLSTLDVLRALVDVPTRHPQTFPHWDEATGIRWTDEWTLEEENVARAPEGAGVLALTVGPLGKRNEVLWVEACDDLRARVRDLVSPPSALTEETKLRRILATPGVCFRAAAAAEAGVRSRVVHLLRERIDHAPPHGDT
jgi:CBS domain-containing protein